MSVVGNNRQYPIQSLVIVASRRFVLRILLRCNSPDYTPPPLKLYLSIFWDLYATLPESTPLSQNIPTFSTTIFLCDAPRLRIYHFLLEYTPLSTTMCDTPRIYPSIREYTSPFFDSYVPSPTSRIYPSSLSTTILR